MKKAKICGWAGMLALAAPWAAAQSVVVMGDSLSDTGQQGWQLKATYLRPDGSAHALYDEHVAAALGGTLGASSLGGSNYAYSGGVVVGSNSRAIAVQPNLALQQQVDNYVAAGVQSRALHIMWGGGNDLAAILTRAQTAPVPAASVVADTQAAAEASARQWQTLRQAGVDTVVMPTVPNVVYTPTLFRQFGNAAASGFGAQVEKVAPGQGDVASAAFAAAFTQAATRLDSTHQQSLADFHATRNQVLADTVAALYAGPLGAALTAAGISQTALTASVQQQYQTFADSATAATTQLNSRTTAAINQVGGNIVRLDTDALFADMLADPARYGLNNTTGTACSGSVAQTVCRPADAAVADAKLFADGFHPGPLAHKVMADYLLGSLRAPMEMAGLRQVGMDSGARAWDFVHQDSNQQRSRRLPAGTLEAVASYRHETGSDGSRNGHVGVKAQLTDHWQLGLVYSRQLQDARSGGSRLDLRGNALTASVRYDAPHWWLGGMLQINDQDYQTRRHLQLGQARVSQYGETSGHSLYAGAFGGYDWHFERARLAMLADVLAGRGEIDGFREQSGGATQMQFDQQEYRSLRSGLGVEAAYRWGGWQPYARSRWVKEWRRNDDVLMASLGGSQFGVRPQMADRSWLNTQLGVAWQPEQSRWRAYAQVGRDFGRNDRHHTEWQIGVAARF